MGTDEIVSRTRLLDNEIKVWSFIFARVWTYVCQFGARRSNLDLDSKSGLHPVLVPK